MGSRTAPNLAGSGRGSRTLEVRYDGEEEARGRRPGEEPRVGRALALDSEDSVVLYNVGCVYPLTGETEKALDCRERAVKNGSGHREWIEHDSDLASLREHPRFKALLASI
jgi:hypothetical protein